MYTPQQTLDAAVDRAAEITWWNRQMTRLNDVIGNEVATDFIQNELVERKGPYVEFVDAPKFDEQPATKFLRALDYDDELVDAIVAELFDGDQMGSLYQHQARTIEATATDKNDNILAVPTATGKTEAFFFPVLERCLSTDESGLKSIIIYPMKTLGVDQLNRFISYLDQINQYRNPEDRITIGIWDSDTPTRVGTRDHEIEQGSYVRGLECPRSGEKLRILSDLTIGTDNNQYSWIRVTRDAIRNGADILLTNPEALDHMFVSDNEETREILGETPGQHPVEHIVFDEAHVWSGISGASVRLLSERLKSFYAERDPQITMVSATVDNPTELAHNLTGTDESTINSIGFTSREFPVSGTPRFDRFDPCTASELAAVMMLAESGEITVGKLETEGLGNAYRTAEEINLVRTTVDGKVTLDSDLEWVANPLIRKSDRLLSEERFDSMAAIATDPTGQDELAEALLDAGGLYSEWFEFIVDSVPEAAEFAHWFDEETTGEVGFKHYDDLVARLEAEGVDDAQGILHTVMAFGRLAGMVTEKYHVFLKPPHQVYLCQECEQVSRNKHCPECDKKNLELQFCKRCHYPYIEVETTEEESFRPFDQETPVDSCPDCNQWPKLTDIGVPTSSLLSYMLTEICRKSPSKKTLVFSDSHSAAESVGDRIIDTEYGLMAETLYVQELIKNGGSMDNYEVFRSVSDRLREEYWEPLIQNEIDEDGTAYNFLRTLLENIEGHAMLHNADNLLDSALVTAKPVTDIEDATALVIAHETFKLFAKDPRTGFAKNRIDIEGLPFPKIVDRIVSRSGFDRGTVETIIPNVLQRLLEQSIIVERSWEEVRQDVANAGVDESKKDATFDYLDEIYKNIEQTDILSGDAESGVFTRDMRRDESKLTLLKQAAFCTECYRSYPVTEHDGIDHCPTCTRSIKTYQRFKETNDGSLIADPGYAQIESGWPYAVDHWAHDITEPIREGGEPDFITAGIHKGNIPHTLRGAIEEGFRKSDPDINIVSATPTMELGVDIGTLDTVSQVGIPPTLTNYVQRSGRTGRTRGSSSLVMTAIRGEHPVDGHYYGNLETFLSNFEPVRVPDPYNFDELLASHVVTEVFAYLARNPHPSNVFNQTYQINEVNQNLGAFVNNVEENLSILREFLLDVRREALENHIEGIFGSEGVDIFEQVFVDEGSLAIENRVEKTFSRITAMSGSAETNKAFTEQNNRLDQWLSHLGYLANYRSFGQQFPVKFQGSSEGIEFEGPGRLYDMYPGPENDLGSVVTLHGTDYIVDDVHGSSTPLTTLNVCDNEDCDRPFEGYSLDIEECAHCGEELEETNIHGVSSVECKPARGGQRMYNTYGLTTTAITSEGPEILRETSQSTVFELQCEADYGELKVTDFVYAFERRHSASPEKKVLRSEALIERDSSSSSAGRSWEERLEEANTEEYAPIGQQYHTQGITLRFDLQNVEERVEGTEHGTDSWPQALVSLEQALDKAIAVVAQCDRSDFRVKTDKTESEVLIQIVDSRQGGNGIAWQVWEEISDVETRVAEIADCNRCNDYCDECLLLSRTPAYYLENDLLNNQMLGRVIGMEEQ